MAAVIGIDLGTTNSVVAVMEDGAPVVIANAEGNRTTPSVVHYGASGEIVVGDMAKRLVVAEPDRAIRSIKRFMGLRFSETEDRRRSIGYQLRGTSSDDIRVIIGESELTPEIVSAEILKKMKATAEAYLGEPVEHAVVTVPAYFNDTQRQATKLAGELAGLDVLRIINEPTAAALAYGLKKTQPQKIAIFDLGGGTFDISLLEIDDGVFEVKSTCGDNFLGGDVFDALFAEHLEKEILDDCGIDITGDAKARQRVMEAAEKIKKELSTLPETTISLPFIGMKDGQPVHYSREILRLEIERVIQPAMECIEGPCRQALDDAGWSPRDLDKVLLVGGSTRMPVVQRLCEEIFEQKPSTAVNPDEAVAVGAAIQGSVLIGGLAEVLLLDVTPLSLGVSSQGGVFNVLIPRNSNIPTEARKAFTTTRDYQRRVRVAVYQGERKVSKENRLLSEFSLENITPAPKGLPHIDVAFRVDANGILNVSATDISTGASQEVRVDSFMTGKGEAERLIAEAQEAAEKDHAFVQRSVLNARAARLQESVQALFDESGDSIQEEDLQRMKELMVVIDVAFYTGDAQKLQGAMGELNELAEAQGDAYLMAKTKLGMA